MFSYQELCNAYCAEEGLDLQLSFDMPQGYENANGTFDIATKTVSINEKMLRDMPDDHKAFFLFHELRHAAQYLHPERFDEEIRRSLPYIVMYDGTCYKFTGGEYRECRLDGGEEVFTDLYLAQPNEADANAFAYEKVKQIFGDSAELRDLYLFWSPRHPVLLESYEAVYSEIDQKTKSKQNA